jgi:hypothetical protein
MKRWSFLIWLLAFMALCGCQSHQARIEARRSFAIDRQHQDFNSRSLIFRECATNILSALLSTNALTLKTPQFASATMGRDEDGEYRLWVCWLEDRPSVDGIEMCFAETNTTAIIPVQISDREENLKSSEVTVVMVARWIWHRTDGIWDKLETIRDVANIKIRLFKGNTPVTEWHPVSFYRLDHWMGSKSVLKVTNGDNADLKGQQ